MLFLKKLEPYFSFTPGERRGVIVLLCIMGVSIFIRIIMPFLQRDKPATITVEELNFKINTTYQKKIVDNNDGNNFFSDINQPDDKIDPNTASAEKLISIGFSKFAAQNILKYRNKGGVFYSNSDLYKIYGVDSTSFEIISKSIRIKNQWKQTAKDENANSSNFQLIELNSADTSLLIKISGVGYVIGGRIIKYRSQLGGFVKKEQLKEIYGLEENTYSNIVKYCTIDTTLLIKLPLNSADEITIEKHPYITKYQAKAILKYRKLVGKFESFADLKQSNIFSDEELNKIIAYLILN